VNEDGYTFNNDDIVDAQLLNSNLIVCKLSDFSLVGTANLMVRASLSNNLRLVSQAGVTLKIVDKSMKGYYFQKETILECPQGSF